MAAPRPPYAAIDRIKLLINIGCTFDIPTGFWVTGTKGESILVGGLAQLTAIVATGNLYKTTLTDYMTLSAASRMDYGGQDVSIGTHDSEINTHTDRKVEMTQKFPIYEGRNLLDEGKWIITDKRKGALDVWYEQYKQFIDTKKKLPAKEMLETPFFGYNNSYTIKSLPVTFNIIDSITDAETSHAESIREKIELGDSDGNTMHMRQGLLKHNLLMSLPVLAGSGQDYMLMTGQYKTDGIVMASGPGQAPPIKKMQHMKPGEKIQGVPGKFFFLLNNCWHITGASSLIHKELKTALYPLDPKDTREDTDLNVLTIKNLRGKAGPSGMPLKIIVSQRDGVLAPLTEFYYLREECEHFGFEGNNTNFSLALLPDVNLSRTTIRSKLANNEKLVRAMNITSELAQMHFYHREMGDLLCDAKVLYEDIKALGYDWDEILTSTRGWYTFPNSYDTELKFLSILDLLRMRKGLYKPYWK